VPPLRRAWMPSHSSQAAPASLRPGTAGGARTSAAMPRVAQAMWVRQPAAQPMPKARPARPGPGSGR
jgi:hypothetical protein